MPEQRPAPDAAISSSGGHGARGVRWSATGALGAPLDGRLELPRQGPPRAVALLAHCFTCGKDVVAAGRIARGLAQRGIAALRFDFTGVGGSGGDFADTDFSSNVRDLVLAGEALRAAGRPPSLLVGHSFGGAAALAAASAMGGVRGVVTLAAPSHPRHILRQISRRDQRDIHRLGRAEVTLAGRPFRIGRGFLTDVVEQPQSERIAGLGRPLLVLHSPQDSLVPYAEAQEIYRTAREPKSLVALDGADHLLTSPAQARRVVELIDDWATPLLASPDGH